MLVVTAGAPSSASTWVTNVVTDLLMVERTTVFRVFADTLADVPKLSGARDIVLKCHHPKPDLRILAATGAAKVILSIRDPRDCVASIMQRFGRDARQAIDDVTSSLAYLDDLSDEGALILRYEDRFFDDPGTVGLISDYLGLCVAEAERRQIGRRYEAGNVMALISTISAMPPSQTHTRSDSIEHIATGFHTGHISDRRSNKYRELLTEREIKFCEAVSSQAMVRYGYGGSNAVLPGRMFACTSLATPVGEKLEIGVGQGCAVYGPYIRLPAGRWRASFMTSDSCAVDVYNGSSTLANGSSREPVEFKVEDPGAPTEFRVHASNLRNCFSGVELLRVSRTVSSG